MIKNADPYRRLPAVYGTIGYRTTEFTRDEQNYLHSRPFLKLPAFHFLLGHSPREGQLPTELAPISTARLDPGQFPDTRHVDRICSQLMQRDGVSERVILAQIRRRTPSAAAQTGPERSARARPQAAAQPGGMSPGQPTRHGPRPHRQRPDGREPD